MLIRFLLIITVCFWGWSFVATKVCLQYMTPLEIIGWRYLLGLPVLLTIILSKKIKISFSKSDWLVIILAAIVISIHFLIQVVGLQYTTASNAGWIIAVSPLVMAILAIIFLGERLTRNAIIGVILATVGIILLISRGNIAEMQWLQSTGDWLIFGSAHTWAIYSVITRNVSRRHSPLVVTFSVLAVSALGIVGTMIFTSDWSKFLHLPTEPIIALLFLGIGNLALAFWMWLEGVARLGASKAGFFLYLEPLATMALAVPYLNEPIGPFIIIGGAVLIFGVYLAQRPAKTQTS